MSVNRLQSYAGMGEISFNQKHFFALLLLTSLLCFLYWALFLPRGHFSLDEGIYHLMSYNIWLGNGLFVENGFKEFPYNSFTLRFLQPSEAGLAPQYPPMYPAIAAPFVTAMGIRGLMLISMVSHLISVWILFRIGQAISNSTVLAACAALLFGFATFALVYAFSAFSHSIATLFLLLTVRALTQRYPALNSDFLISGFFIGLACLVRLDSILALGAIGLWLLWMFSFSQAAIRGLYLALGLTPTIIFLSWINSVKFGTLNPVSYGASSGKVALGAHIPLLLSIPVVIAGLFVLKSNQYRGLSRNIKIAIWLGSGVVAATLLTVLSPNTSEKVLNGLLGLLVDMRFLNITVPEPAMYFGSGGSIMYSNVYKKAFFQSLPFISAGTLLGSVYAIQNQKNDNGTSLLLWLVACFIMLPFIFLSWHGGLSFNQRYFLPALPLLTLISVMIFRPCFSLGWKIVPVVIGIAITIAAYALSNSLKKTSSYGPMELILPLLLTIPIVFLGSCLLFKKHWIEARFCTISSFFVASSLTWGLMTTIGDIYSAHDRRDHLFKMGSWTERFFDDRSILITDFPDPFFGNIRNGVKFANPSLDSFEDVKKIVKKSESSNYKLYFFLSQRSWTAINNLGALDGYDLCRYSIGQGLPLVVLSRNNCGKAN